MQESTTDTSPPKTQPPNNQPPNTQLPTTQLPTNQPPNNQHTETRPRPTSDTTDTTNGGAGDVYVAETDQDVDESQLLTDDKNVNEGDDDDVNQSFSSIDSQQSEY